MTKYYRIRNCAGCRSCVCLQKQKENGDWLRQKDRVYGCEHDRWESMRYHKMLCLEYLIAERCFYYRDKHKYEKTIRRLDRI